MNDLLVWCSPLRSCSVVLYVAGGKTCLKTLNVFCHSGLSFVSIALPFWMNLKLLLPGHNWGFVQ